MEYETTRRAAYMGGHHNTNAFTASGDILLHGLPSPAPDDVAHHCTRCAWPCWPGTTMCPNCHLRTATPAVVIYRAFLVAALITVVVLMSLIVLILGHLAA